MNRKILKGFIFATICSAAATEFVFGNDYIDWSPCGPDFPNALQEWKKGDKLTADDNFFISRIKPKNRFRNSSTQVNPDLSVTNDKNLLLWIPVNTPEKNALPDGKFDSEVFPMWPYVTHFGNWSAPLVRIPGGFADVAHKNGVPVSVVAPIPMGNLNEEWSEALEKLIEIGPEKLADFMLYYGVDGIGYNSEFYNNTDIVGRLGEVHSSCRKLLREFGSPYADFIWYDGTNSDGYISFDLGLDIHNQNIWGWGENERTSLFLNYNWNSEYLMDRTVKKANSLNRTPLDIYCGINLQGREPSNRYGNWTLLADYPLSIGIWGAHSMNMFYESRGSNGSKPHLSQKNYLRSVENWFTGGSLNPVNTPPLSNTLIYSADNRDFPGMSKMMSARSSLKWNLSEEPFITYFNLGNGKFFNYKGVRQHNSEWYNISMQDFLPTWRWWFSSKFLGREVEDVPRNGLEAEFVWDDAWMGGSCLRINGSTDDEYLHLFKTDFTLEEGDEITVRFKVLEGCADLTLAMSVKGYEDAPVSDQFLYMLDSSQRIYGHWIEKKFTVGKDIKLDANNELALVAMHFRSASRLDMRLGEFSIIRKDGLCKDIPTPEIESTELLSARHDGVDGKVVFNMPNDKGNEVCYNLDVNTSLFKLYSQQENMDPVLMGMTTSWAGLVFSAPYSESGKERVRFGVSALGLDHLAESEIAWGKFHDIESKYKIDDNIIIPKGPLGIGVPFVVSYSDDKHEPAEWYITDVKGDTILSCHESRNLLADNGIGKPGIYNLTVDGFEGKVGERERSVRNFIGCISIVDGEEKFVPEILTIDSPDAVFFSEDESLISVFGFDDEEARLVFSADLSDRELPRGVKTGREGFGFKWNESGLENGKSFTVGLRIKVDPFQGSSSHLLNVRFKGDTWPVNEMGWFRHIIDDEGRSKDFILRLAENIEASYKFDDLQIIPDVWTDIFYIFEFDADDNVLPHIYVNGEEKKVTAWSIGERLQDDLRFCGPVAEITPESILSLGGYLRSIGSLHCSLDDFLVWDRVLSEREISSLSGEMDEQKLLATDPICYYGFEDSPDASGRFLGKGTAPFRGGMHSYVDTESEGQGILSWNLPDYCPGSPFSSGESYLMHTNVSWQLSGTIITDETLSEEGGEITLRLADGRLCEVYKEGFPVRLTLSNDFGSDYKDCLLNFKPTSVGMVQKNNNFEVVSSSFTDELSIITRENGNITVSIYSLDGCRLLSNTFLCTSEKTLLKVYPDLDPGVYLVVVENGDCMIGSRKVVSR